MGGLGHFEVSLAWGIPSPNYIAYNNGPNATHGGNHFVRCLPQGDKVVPLPHERPSLIQKVHSKLGHFRVKRTYSLFAPHYHWKSMYAQVQNITARCE
jgi:hypothetical protein